MRRVGIIMTAGAALVLALVVPTVAGATSKSTTAQKGAEISAQGVGLDDQFTAQGKRGKGDKYRHGYRHRHRHGYYHYRHHRYYRGGYCYGCWGPGSYCDRYGCYYQGHPYYYGGYYGGGYGCNFDYPCGPPYGSYDCTRYRGPDGKPVQDPHCKYDPRCDCYYHSSERPQPAPESQPGPDPSAQPAPDQGQAQPAPDQGQAPPEQGMQPAPDQGSQPQPY